MRNFTLQKIKKFLLTVIFLTSVSAFAQLNTVLPNNGTYSNKTGPQGALRYQRALYLLTPAELNTSGLTSGMNINSIGFTIARAQSDTTNGSFKVYLQNTTDNISRADTAWTTINSNTNSYAAAALFPGKYEWQVKSNCSSSSAFSPTVNFSNDFLSGCNNPYNLSTSSVTNTTATVSWEAPISPTFVSYKIEYSRIDLVNWISANTTDTFYNATGLTAGITYQWRVKTVCSSTGSSLNYSSFTTGTSPVCNAVSVLSAVVSGSNNVALSWAAAAGATYYEVQFKRTDVNTWSSTIVFSNSTGLTLPSGTSYQWQVRAVCTGGSGTFVAGTGFTTGGSIVCYTPSNLLTKQITSSSALFTWNAVAGSTSYTIRYRLKNTISWSNAITPMTLASADSLNIPKITGPYNIPFKGGSAFVYGGGGLYVAYEYERPAGALSTINLTLSTSKGTSIQAVNGTDSVDILLSLVSSDDTALTALPEILAGQKLRPETRLGSVDLKDSVEVVGVYALGKTPVAFASPSPISALIANKTNQAKNYPVTLTITSKVSSEIRYTSTQNKMINAGDTALVKFTGWSPSILEEDVIVVSVASQVNENVLNNNSRSYNQLVTKNSLSYEDGSAAVTEAGFNTGAGLLLNKHRLTGCGKILSAQVYLSESAKGKSVFAVVTNAAGSIVAQSSPFVPDSSEINKYRSFYFSNPPAFSNEDFYIGLSQAASAQGYNPVGVQWEDARTGSGTYYRANLDGTNLVNDSTHGRFMIRADIAASSPEPFISGINTLCSGASAVLSVESAESRYANSVIAFSSQNGNVEYSALQALGTPNVFPANSLSPNAWTSATPDAAVEFLVLGFPNDAPINFIDVYEASNAGAITNISVKNSSTLVYSTVFTGTASATAVSGKKRFNFPITLFNVSEIRIELNSAAVPGYNSIDAVAIGQSILPASFSSYAWSPGGETSSTKTITTAGTYKLTVTNASGCTFSDSIVVAAATTTLPLITANRPLTFCEGDSTILTSSSLTGNTWSTGAATRSIIVKTAGSYTVSYNDPAGCGSLTSAATTINVNPLPTLSITGVTAICPGNSTTLNAGSGYTSYLWSSGETSPSITVNSAAVFSVKVTNTNGCAKTVSATTTISPLPSPVISGTLQFCPGSSTVLDGGAGFTTYSWSNGATTQTITVSTGATFTVTVSNVNGCFGTASATTSLYNSPTPSISGSAAVCPDGFVTLTADAGYNTYLWSTGATTQSITVNAANTYTVTVTNSNGCTGSVSKMVTTASVPTPVISGTLSFCGGSSTTLTANAGYSSYTWSNGATSQSILVSSPGTYSVTVTNASGCSGSTLATATAQGSVPATPGMITGNTGGICNSSNNVYSINAVTNAAFYVWTVPNGATITSGQGTTAITVTFSNTFTGGNIIVAASNACGQSPSNTPRTLAVQGAAATPGNITGIVSGLCSQVGKVYSIAPVYGASSYTWTVPTGATMTSGQGTNTITVNYSSSFSSGSICVKANSTCGNSANSCVTVSGAPETPNTINGPSSVCSKQKNVAYSIATVAGATSYVWTVPSLATIVSGQGTASIVVTFGTKTGGISVKAFNACGSSTLKTLAVNFVACYSSNLISEVEKLEPENIISGNILVYPNPTVGPVIIVINGEKGKYKLMVNDATGRTVFLKDVKFDGNKISADFKFLAKGIYTLQVFNTNYKKLIKLIIQ